MSDQTLPQGQHAVQHSRGIPAQGCPQRTVFAGQARLVAERAERGLLIASGSLQRLVHLGERLDAELLLERRP